MTHRTSAEWLECFAPDKPEWREINFAGDPGVTRAELAPILRSIQAWQLGETSDGRHLRSVAKRYAERIGDSLFLEVVERFIREEQGHGEALGKFLDAVGARRIDRNWGDSLFRMIRYALPSMELWTTIVIMVETMALLFYGALRKATPSPMLRAICDQILRDEGPHLRFQYERLALLHTGRRRWLLRLTHAAQRGLFLCVVLAVWFDNHRLLRAGGYSFRRYWSQAWRKMRFHWRRMEPEQEAARSATARASLQRTAAREAPSRLSGWLH
jgi:hypothetical protein